MEEFGPAEVLRREEEKFQEVVAFFKRLQPGDRIYIPKGSRVLIRNDDHPTAEVLVIFEDQDTAMFQEGSIFKLLAAALCAVCAIRIELVGLLDENKNVLPNATQHHRFASSACSGEEFLSVKFLCYEVRESQ
ncbi:MAG: cupin domain-containing protein [Candidatus Andersenbacteria bacterium]|nr:cupin domain-containing protein [Candidatus Andersenbacteria bacterium]